MKIIKQFLDQRAILREERRAKKRREQCRRLVEFFKYDNEETTPNTTGTKRSVCYTWDWGNGFKIEYQCEIFWSYSVYYNNECVLFWSNRDHERSKYDPYFDFTLLEAHMKEALKMPFWKWKDRMDKIHKL